MEQQEEHQYQETPYRETQEENREICGWQLQLSSPLDLAAGCNVITWAKEKGITGGKLVAVNTDATHLKISKQTKES